MESIKKRLCDNKMETNEIVSIIYSKSNKNHGYNRYTNLIPLKVCLIGRKTESQEVLIRFKKSFSVG